jgi:peptide/nickel transport system permease protein
LALPAQLGAAESEVDEREQLASARGFQTWYRFRRHRLALIGAVLLGLIALVSIFAPLLAPYDPYMPDPMNMFAAPDLQHWLGTDQDGSDVLSRLIYGGRYSLGIGVSAALISTIVGVAIGALAGWVGGWIDNGLMRFVDLMLSFPSLFLLLILFSITNGASVTVIILFLGLFGWMYMARIVRAQVLALKEMDFVQSAQAVGISARRIIVRHLLPNALAAVIVTCTLEIAYNMLYEAILDFLGFGVSPDTPTWGNMLNSAEQHLLDAPQLAIAPGLILTVAVLCINFIGDGLRDALDPRLK